MNCIWAHFKTHSKKLWMKYVLKAYWRNNVNQFNEITQPPSSGDHSSPMYNISGSSVCGGERSTQMQNIHHALVFNYLGFKAPTSNNCETHYHSILSRYTAPRTSSIQWRTVQLLSPKHCAYLTKKTVVDSLLLIMGLLRYSGFFLNPKNQQGPSLATKMHASCFIIAGLNQGERCMP